MTQEDKELLLKDLSARLPYGFIIYSLSDNANIKINDICGFAHFLEYSDGEEFKPYLRPMSSMTEEEKNEYFGRTMTIDIVKTSKEVIDWCNKNHFDFRNLIERGLAIEVTEENNPYK